MTNDQIHQQINCDGLQSGSGHISPHPCYLPLSLSSLLSLHYYGYPLYPFDLLEHPFLMQHTLLIVFTGVNSTTLTHPLNTYHPSQFTHYISYTSHHTHHRVCWPRTQHPPRCGSSSQPPFGTICGSQ